MVSKVLTYITQDDKLLVFRQPHAWNAGVQIPGGSIEPGEAPEAAALREAHEETGLTNFELVSLLGTALYTPKLNPGPAHTRHFFHLSYEGETPDTWDHYEVPSTGGSPILFRMSWEPITTVRLDWEMDAFMSALLTNR